MKLHVVRLRKWMKEHDLNQTMLADVLGVSRKYVNRCLAGEAPPDTLLGRLKSYAPELSVDYFIDWGGCE